MHFGKDCYLDINYLINKKFEEKNQLIAVHRGSWTGNIIQNTIPAYICAIKMGADIVECDVNRSIDGILYSFHDGYENLLFHVDKSIKQMSSSEIESYHPYNSICHQNKNRINRLSEILDWLPKDKLINIDRAWDIFPYLLEELDKHPDIISQVIIKSPVKGEFHGVLVEDALSVLQNHKIKYMYMPICYDLDDVRKALSLQGLNIVGCELMARDENDELFKDEAITFIHNKHLFTWVNSIELGNYNRKPLYGPLDDDVSIIENPDLGWGELIKKRIDIIQTDWPAILLSYLKERENND